MHYSVAMAFLVDLAEEYLVERGWGAGHSRVVMGDYIASRIVVVLVMVGRCCCIRRRVGLRADVCWRLRVRLRNRLRRSIVGLALVAARALRFGPADKSVAVGEWSRACRRLTCPFLEVDDPSIGIGGAEGFVDSQHTGREVVAREAATVYGSEEVERRLGMEAGRIAEIVEVVESRASRC